MTPNDQAKPREKLEPIWIECEVDCDGDEDFFDFNLNVINIEGHDQGQEFSNSDTIEFIEYSAFTALQAENAKLKEAYGVVRKALKDAQSIERDRIFEDLRCPGFDGSMKIETRYDEALAKAEEVLR